MPRLSCRKRESDRYTLTPLAEQFMEDPLETWLALGGEEPEEPPLQLVEPTQEKRTA